MHSLLLCVHDEPYYARVLSSSHASSALQHLKIFQEVGGPVDCT